MKLKKKERKVLLTLALAGSAAYFIRTFPGGDTLMGGIIGAAFGHPFIGAAAGLFVPSRGGEIRPVAAQAVADARRLAEEAAGRTATGMAPNGQVTN